MFWRKPKKKHVVEYSNVIQFDVMESPLRLCIFNDDSQGWIDTVEREGDVVLLWTKTESIQKEK